VKPDEILKLLEHAISDPGAFLPRERDRYVEGIHESVTRWSARAVLAAVLPVHKRQVREQAAKELLERSARPGWSTKFRDGLRYAAAYLVRGEQR
jgi:hypothetical protein